MQTKIIIDKMSESIQTVVLKVYTNTNLQAYSRVVLVRLERLVVID